MNDRVYNDFSEELWSTIETELTQHMQRHVSPFYAAFDADGTLWDVDAGETFFQYQIDHCQLKGLPADPWAYYHEWKERDAKGAYLWLAQINAGIPLSQVRRWAKDCLRGISHWPVFPSQRKLIQWFKSKGVRVFVVTASIKWAVEPFAELLGLHYDDVIGVETKTRNGIVTDEIKGMITWRQGKPDSLLQLTDGIKPIFCTGNTMGDLHLLESASVLRLAISSVNNQHENFETELSLQKVAIENGWLHHKF